MRPGRRGRDRAHRGARGITSEVALRDGPPGPADARARRPVPVAGGRGVGDHGGRGLRQRPPADTVRASLQAQGKAAQPHGGGRRGPAHPPGAGDAGRARRHGGRRLAGALLPGRHPRRGVHGGAVPPGLRDATAGSTAWSAGRGSSRTSSSRTRRPSRSTRVFDTKARAIFHLAQSLRPESLKFFVIFSSVAGWTGNRGQVDYVAGNEVLNRMALHLSARWNRRVVAIDWGPWDKVGHGDAGDPAPVPGARGRARIAGRRQPVPPRRDPLRQTPPTPSWRPWAGWRRRNPPAGGCPRRRQRAWSISGR